MRIQRIVIRGFRSLSNVTIAGLGPVNLFYGENNTGKSNILAVLETAFKVEKVEELESPVAGFLRSELSNFVDNFTIKEDGTRANQINVDIRLGLDENDLRRIPTFNEVIREQGVYEQGHLQRIRLQIDIVPTGTNTAVRSMKIATINNKLMYDLGRSEIDRFFPGLKVRVEERQQSVEQIFLYFLNCFVVIQAKRFLQEEVLEEYPVTRISVQKLKNWLLRLSESRGIDYQTFNRITEWFNDKPFKYGIIRPIVEEGHVTLVVKDNSDRELIIDRLGTGVQQTLMLLSHLSYYDARMIGIEEVELNLSPSLQNRLLSMLREIVIGAGGSIDQLFITSHSMHLSTRHDSVLYAVQLDSVGETQVTRGPKAIAQFHRHFDYGLIRIPRSRIWRS